MKDETLLPCPFCGSTECEAFAQDEEDCPYQSAIVRCFNCDAQSAQMVGKDKISRAIAAWNKRASLQPGNSAQPVTVPAGYVLVPVDLLSDLRDFAHPEIEKYCEMWEGRRDEEFPAMRKIISDADALLSAAQQSPGSQLTTTPGWTGNGDANAALVMLDRIDTLAPEDDDRIEEVKQIIRSLAALKSPDGWIPVSERCPKANDHRNACTGSNEPGQPGSAYPDAPKGV